MIFLARKWNKERHVMPIFGLIYAFFKYIGVRMSPWLVTHPPGALGKCNVNWAGIYAAVMSSVLSRQLSGVALEILPDDCFTPVLLTYSAPGCTGHAAPLA